MAIRTTTPDRVTGAGVVGDDFDHDDVKDYRYRGWEAKAVYVIVKDELEAGFRVDSYWEEVDENRSNWMINHTFGVTYKISRSLKLQLNYKRKKLLSKTDPDLDDDVFLLAFQFKF